MALHCGNSSVTDVLFSLWITEIISDDVNACALSKAGQGVDEMRTKVTSGTVELFVQKSYNCAKHPSHSSRWSVHIYK